MKFINFEKAMPGVMSRSAVISFIKRPGALMIVIMKPGWHIFTDYVRNKSVEGRKFFTLTISIGEVKRPLEDL